MNVSIQLFGAFRQFQPSGEVQLACPDAHSIADVRSALHSYAVANWPDFHPALLRVSAFASASSVLRDAHPIPDDRQLAILPPVSGG